LGSKSVDLLQIINYPITSKKRKGGRETMIN
jgi:hypothetical protein